MLDDPSVDGVWRLVPVADAQPHPVPWRCNPEDPPGGGGDAADQRFESEPPTGGLGFCATAGRCHA